MMTMQPSRTTMKTANACEQALHLRDIEKSHSRVACGRRSRSKVRGKRSESSLARSLDTRNGEVPTRHNVSWWSCSFAIR